MKFLFVFALMNYWSASIDRSQSNFDLIKERSSFCRHSIQSKSKLRSPLSRSAKCISSDNVIVNGKWRFPHQKQYFVLSLVVAFQRCLENNHFSRIEDDSGTDSLDLDSAENVRISLHFLVINASVCNLWDTTIRQLECFFLLSPFVELLITSFLAGNPFSDGVAALLQLSPLLYLCRLYRLFSTPLTLGSATSKLYEK